MELHGTDFPKYRRRNVQLYAIVFYISLVASVGIMVLARPGIEILYGTSYLGAVTPLRIITWYTAFSYLGVARNAWMVCENKQKYLKHLYVSAAILNVIINFILIPSFGSAGAAMASLITQICTSIVLPFLIKPIRENAVMMIEAITLKDLLWRKK